MSLFLIPILISIVGLFLLIQFTRGILWRYTSGGGKAKAAAEFQRIKRETPESPLLQNTSEAEFSLEYVKKNGTNPWSYLILMILLGFVAPLMFGGLMLSSL